MGQGASIARHHGPPPQAAAGLHAYCHGMYLICRADIEVWPLWKVIGRGGGKKPGHGVIRQEIGKLPAHR